VPRGFRRRAELRADDKGEHKELMAIYVGRGLDPSLTEQVANQLMAHDAIGAHARDEAPRADWREQNAYTLGVQAYLYAFPWAYMPDARWQRTEAIDPASTARRTAAGAEFLALED
jgi:hypothetical protein